MRPGAGGGLTGWSKDEKFSRLGATLRIANGDLTSDDIRFESENLMLDAQGAVQTMASTVNLKGKVQLSDALSQQGGSDLLRYTQESGRVTLPATVAALKPGGHGNQNRSRRCVLRLARPEFIVPRHGAGRP